MYSYNWAVLPSCTGWTVMVSASIACTIFWLQSSRSNYKASHTFWNKTETKHWHRFRLVTDPFAYLFAFWQKANEAGTSLKLSQCYFRNQDVQTLETRNPSCHWEARATRKHTKNCSNSTCLQRLFCSFCMSPTWLRWLRVMVWLPPPTPIRRWHPDLRLVFTVTCRWSLI